MLVGLAAWAFLKKKKKRNPSVYPNLCFLKVCGEKHSLRSCPKFSILPFSGPVEGATS